MLHGLRGMEFQQTPYGRLAVGAPDALFRHCADRIIALAEAHRRDASVALSGGSTPMAFYAWCRAHHALSADNTSGLVWTVSDERHVPLTSTESNFGNAERELLGPIGIGERAKMPWPVEVDPHSASVLFNRRWNERFGAGEGFDLCFLGMGDDGHTASLFPGSPLLGDCIDENFACVDVPGKGWRLTVTRNGLLRSREVIVAVTGAAKAAMLRQVLEGPPDVYPIQILRAIADRVTWLVDPAAAGA